MHYTFNGGPSGVIRVFWRCLVEINSFVVDIWGGVHFEEFSAEVLGALGVELVQTDCHHHLNKLQRSPSAKYAAPASHLTGMCSSLSYCSQLCCRQYPWILYNHQLRAFPGDYVYQECEELFVAEINIITVYRPARVGWTFNPTSAKHSYKEFIQVGNRIEAWSGRPSDELWNWQPHHFLPTNQRGPGQASSSSELDLLE